MIDAAAETNVPEFGDGDDGDTPSDDPKSSGAEAYPWAQSKDEMRRCYVFEQMVPIELADKLGTMIMFDRWLKTGEAPASPASAPTLIRGGSGKK